MILFVMLQVGENTWALSVAYDATSKKLESLLRDQERENEADAIIVYKDDLVDKDNGANQQFWENLAENGRLMGSYQAILDGTKSWNADLGEFQI